MKRYMVLFLFAASSAHAQNGQAWVVEPQDNGKSISCATALGTTGQFDPDTRFWALGFWSGQNTARLAMVGHTTDANGIIGEIEKLCRNEPAMPYVSAVGSTYITMKKAGR
jgi:hypothetical protein